MKYWVLHLFGLVCTTLDYQVGGAAESEVNDL